LLAASSGECTDAALLVLIVDERLQIARRLMSSPVVSQQRQRFFIGSCLNVQAVFLKLVGPSQNDKVNSKSKP
jgi:hypothetical protein